MANYDSPASFYDSGLLYDSVDAPIIPGRKKRMAKIKLDLKSLTVADKIAQGHNIVTKLTGNANFPVTNPTLAAFTTTVTAFDAANAARIAAVTAADITLTNRNTNEAAYDAAINLLATDIQNKSGGDIAKIQSAGMDVGAAAAPVGLPGQVMNLNVTCGDFDRQLDSQWDPTPGATFYERQKSVDPITLTSWEALDPVTKSKATTTDLTSGTKVWQRVRARNSAGAGPWSDPAVKTVP